ncbi:MAG: hypothetical protein ACUVSS_15720 [Anaerolineae bacterium]
MEEQGTSGDHEAACGRTGEEQVHGDLAIEGFPRQEELKTLVAGLAERFARISTQLGCAKESEVRELLRKLAGRTVFDAYLG